MKWYDFEVGDTVQLRGYAARQSYAKYKDMRGKIIGRVGIDVNYPGDLHVQFENGDLIWASSDNWLKVENDAETLS